jgi:hypothetical protein
LRKENRAAQKSGGQKRYFFHVYIWRADVFLLYRKKGIFLNIDSAGNLINIEYRCCEL